MAAPITSSQSICVAQRFAYALVSGIMAALVLQVTAPPEWAPILKSKFNNTDPNFTIKYYDTQLVSSGDARDSRLGAWPFPAERGALSKAALAFIEDGAPELWPDWEAGPHEQQALLCSTSSARSIIVLASCASAVLYPHHRSIAHCRGSAHKPREAADTAVACSWCGPGARSFCWRPAG